MYSRITKIYYRIRIYETCTDRRNNSKIFSPVNCFSSWFTFLPLGDASVCSEKMAAPGEKIFLCWNITRVIVVTVQRAFRAKYAKDRPTDKTIPQWYKQLTETGCLCKQKSSGRPLTAEDDVERVRASFLQSPKKSAGTATKELSMSKTTVWRVLRSVWCLNHTSSKWYNNCPMKITGAGMISVYRYKTW